MVRTAAVVTVLVVLMVTSQVTPLETNQNDEGDLSVEIVDSNEVPIMSEDQVYQEYMELRSEGNEIIRLYLKEFEKMRKSDKFKDSANVMEVVQLLITESWVYLLEPEKNFRADIISADMGAESFDDIRKNLIDKIKEINEKSPVVDAVLLYHKSVQKKMVEEFQAEAQKYGQIIETKLKEIIQIEDEEFQDEAQKHDQIVGKKLKVIKITEDEKKKEQLIQEKTDAFRKLEEYRILIEYHYITFKMCLQSYVLNFLEKPYGKTMVLSSTDGLDTRYFYIPSTGKDQFEDLFNYAELDEDETTEPQPDYGISLINHKATTDAEYKEMQSVFIAKYLYVVEDVSRRYHEYIIWKTLSVIRRLILQCYIHTVKPDNVHIEILHDFIPAEENEQIEDIQKELVKEITQINEKDPVAYSMIRYYSKIKKQIQDGIDVKIKAMEEVIEVNKNNIQKIDDAKVKEEITKMMAKNTERLEELKLIRKLHGVSFRMSLQSYILDFVQEPYGKDVKIIGSEPDKREEKFAVPSLQPDAFQDFWSGVVPKE